MTIIDARIHVWSRNTPERRWLHGHGHPSHGAALSAEEVLRVMDATGVARAVLVPPSWIGDDNRDSLDAARRYPDRFAVRSTCRRGARGSPTGQWTARRCAHVLGLVRSRCTDADSAKGSTMRAT